MQGCGNPKLTTSTPPIDNESMEMSKPRYVCNEFPNCGPCKGLCVSSLHKLPTADVRLDEVRKIRTQDCDCPCQPCATCIALVLRYRKRHSVGVGVVK